MYGGFFPDASNRADWSETVLLTDEDTGEAIDISLCRVTLTVTRLPSRQSGPFIPGYYDWGPLYGYGYGVVLTGSTDDGTITLPDVGTLQWLFIADRMASLPFGAYQIGARISQDTRTAQLIIGRVNVTEGIDTQ
jgi:hypothetical protein